ncbi:glycosyltransferase (plasmid) [Azospirillum argentinense]|uniref:Glycosyltransferase n=1 Tax=Azospirillum argentinense TaxID=2970906 RepID=A0A4D8PSR5_9PROT|nr:glycosyltransferase [Azospirillum argentinense]QCO00361.1 glycosyltransferase [Azospirillum argentinense]
MSNDNHTIDVIVRFHDASKGETLLRALFCLYGQTYPAVQPILVLQGFSDGDVEAVERLVSRFAWNGKRRRPIVHNYVPPASGDHRSRLINEGFWIGTGRYIAILDYDDVIYSHAYTYLIDRLQTSNAAIAFGRIAVKHVMPLKHYDFVLATTRDNFKGAGLSDLFVDNFCPIHSFVLDRSKVAAEELRFDETMTRLEDYDFLLRICAKHPADFEGLARFVGTYYWRIDGSNTVQSYGPGAEENRRQWQEAREKIRVLKKELGLLGAKELSVVQD